MSTESLCGFCAELPVLDHKKSGRESRCPLCKSNLLTAAQGKVYRLVEPSEAAAPQESRWPKVAVGSLLLALLATAAFIVSRGATTPVPSPIPFAQTPAGPQSSPEIFASAKPAATAPVIAPKRSGPPLLAKAQNKPADRIAVAAKSAAGAHLAAVAKPRGEPKVQPLILATPSAYKPSPQELQIALANVPEVSLQKKAPSESSYRDVSVAKESLVKLLKEIAEQDKKNHDGFIRDLRDKRVELAGLPFLLGNACRADSFAAKSLGAYSRLVRAAFAESEESGSTRSSATRTSAQPSHSSFPAAYRSDRFWKIYLDASADDGLRERLREDIKMVTFADGVPALRQILGPEEASLRVSLAYQLNKTRQRVATETLVQLALFDPEEPVRNYAVEFLKRRPRDDLGDALLAGFRYPWLPVAHRASGLAIALQRDDLVPALARLLDEPDPLAPRTRKKDGGLVHEVSELVRINHHRNCLLCHAPVEPSTLPRSRTLPFAVGVVPIPGTPLPPSVSNAYYSKFASDSILVRADITYLRQDFSMYQHVADSGNWPALQRFDFLVRTRQISADEAERWPKSANDHRQVILHTLRTLTGQNHGAGSAEWRGEVARLEAGSDRFTRSPCDR